MSDDPFGSLPAKDRRPASANILDKWVSQAQSIVGGRGRRTGWILASTVALAALQRAHGDDDAPLFLVKGGVYLERTLGLLSRSTKDLDTLFRGSVTEFLSALDSALAEPWGGIRLSRTEIEIIDAPRTVKPRRFDILLAIRGTTWRQVQVEVALGEGSIGSEQTTIAGPNLRFFGVQPADELVGITMAYQIAQKLHACSDPHNPPEHVNDRVRDIVDLLLIRAAFYDASADLSAVRAASEDVFTARALEAIELGSPPRSWPPLISSNPVWETDFVGLASEVGMSIPLSQALTEVNTWVSKIAAAPSIGMLNRRPPT